MFEVRTASVFDKETIRQIYGATAGLHTSQAEPPWDELIRTGGLIVGELDGALIGFGGIDVQAVEQLKWLYLLPQYQRAGWGSEILKRLEDIGWEAGLDFLRLHSAPDAVGFYRIRGYREVDAAERIGHNHDGVEMVKFKT